MIVLTQKPKTEIIIIAHKIQKKKFGAKTCVNKARPIRSKHQCARNSATRASKGHAHVMNVRRL